MRVHPAISAALTLVTALASFQVYAGAQGCAQRPSIVMHTYCDQTQGYCISQECIDGGRDVDYCYEGYTECCDMDFTTANLICDVDECCGDGGDCSGGCLPVKRGATRTAGLLRCHYIPPVFPSANCAQRLHLQKFGSAPSFEMLMDDRFSFWNALLDVRSENRK